VSSAYTTQMTVAQNTIMAVHIRPACHHSSPASPNQSIITTISPGARVLLPANPSLRTGGLPR
jgi:hypothetical protein